MAVPGVPCCGPPVIVLSSPRPSRALASSRACAWPAATLDRHGSSPNAYSDPTAPNCSPPPCPPRRRRPGPPRRRRPGPPRRRRPGPPRRRHRRPDQTATPRAQIDAQLGLRMLGVIGSVRVPVGSAGRLAHHAAILVHRIRAAEAVPPFTSRAARIRAGQGPLSQRCHSRRGRLLASWRILRPRRPRESHRQQMRTGHAMRGKKSRARPAAFAAEANPHSPTRDSPAWPNAARSGPGPRRETGPWPDAGAWPDGARPGPGSGPEMAPEGPGGGPSAVSGGLGGNQPILSRRCGPRPIGSRRSPGPTTR